MLYRVGLVIFGFCPSLQDGINNRNLETFKVDLDNTRQLLEARGEKVREKGILIVSESGLHTAAALAKVKQELFQERYE